jgi:hypothetical protein
MNKTLISNLNTKLDNLVRWDYFFTYSHDSENYIIASHKGKEVRKFVRTHHLSRVKSDLTKIKAKLLLNPSAICDAEVSQGHPHARLMISYGMDAMKHDKPWMLWEFSEGAQYNLCAGPLTFNRRYKYRKIMPMSVCNGIKIPSPHKGSLVHNQKIYVPTPSLRELATELRWIGDELQKRLQDMNLIHEDKDAAVQHCRAMLILK